MKAFAIVMLLAALLFALVAFSTVGHDDGSAVVGYGMFAFGCLAISLVMFACSANQSTNIKRQTVDLLEEIAKQGRKL